jgi:hypothetical protein
MIGGGILCLKWLEMMEKYMGNKFILVELRNQNWTGCLSISLLRFEP